MIKKGSIALLAGILVLSGIAAASPKEDMFVVQASLTNNQTGERIELPVTYREWSTGPGQYVTEYEILMPLANTTEQSREDSTYSARAVVRQTWLLKYNADQQPCVRVTSYTGKWVRIDPAVTATNLKVQALVYSESCDTGNQINKQGTVTKANPVNGTWYTIYPTWSGEYYLVNELGYSQAGKTIVTLKRGATTWTFEVMVSQN